MLLSEVTPTISTESNRPRNTTTMLIRETTSTVSERFQRSTVHPPIGNHKTMLNYHLYLWRICFFKILYIHVFNWHIYIFKTSVRLVWVCARVGVFVSPPVSLHPLLFPLTICLSLSFSLLCNDMFLSFIWKVKCVKYMYMLC